jgi:hypothetical protein
MMTKNDETVRRINWEGWFFSLLGLVLTFTTTIYGHVKPAWGGGAVSPVTIHFGHPTQFSPSNDVAAYLIDETDKGFYLAHKIEITEGRLSLAKRLRLSTLKNSSEHKSFIRMRGGGPRFLWFSLHSSCCGCPTLCCAMTRINSV